MNEDEFTRARLTSKCVLRTSVCAGAQHVCACMNEVAGCGEGGKGLEKDGAKHRRFVMTSKVSELVQMLMNSADLSE